jgi:hypothetical protein
LAAAKSTVQRRVLGYPCAILECARLNHIDYCPRDCPSFPCHNFTTSNYPFGQGFLKMQQRRRNQGPPAVDPSGRPVEVSDEQWDILCNRDVKELSNFTLIDIDMKSGYLCFPFLNRTILVDTGHRCLMEKGEGQTRWQKISIALLEVSVLEYLTRVNRLYPLGREMVGTDDLVDAHYFEEGDRLNKGSLLARYGDDPNGFSASGQHLKGQPQDMADAAFRLTPLPRIPIYYLLWLGSNEFPPRVSILFDRSIQEALSAPSIWSLVSLCNYYLLRGVE